MLSIEGNCSIENTRKQLAVTCKEGPDRFKKHYLGSFRQCFLFR